MNYKANATMIEATKKDEEVIRNLMQFYIYDFSEFVDCVVEKSGLYPEYPLDAYWMNAQHHYAYLVKVGEQLAGFVLVRFNLQPEPGYFSVAEFFVMKKYRRAGVGTTVAKKTFDLHHGFWSVHQQENNLPAQMFWLRVIADYTNNSFTDHFEQQRRIQQFSNA